VVALMSSVVRSVIIRPKSWIADGVPVDEP